MLFGTTGSVEQQYLIPFVILKLASELRRLVKSFVDLSHNLTETADVSSSVDGEEEA